MRHISDLTTEYLRSSGIGLATSTCCASSFDNCNRIIRNARGHRLSSRHTQTEVDIAL